MDLRVTDDVVGQVKVKNIDILNMITRWWLATAS